MAKKPPGDESIFTVSCQVPPKRPPEKLILSKAKIIRFTAIREHTTLQSLSRI